MEARGLVNQWETKPIPTIGPNCGTEKVAVHSMSVQVRRTFSLNVACGTTPFCTRINGVEYTSNCYRVMVPRVQVEWVWYRPDRAEFDVLDSGSQHHVLNGGLLRGPLGHGTLADDPTHPETDFEAFQDFVLQVYGRRLPPMRRHTLRDGTEITMPDVSEASEAQARALRDQFYDRKLGEPHDGPVIVIGAGAQPPGTVRAEVELTEDQIREELLRLKKEGRKNA